MCVMGKTEQICTEDGKMSGVWGIFGMATALKDLYIQGWGAFREIPLHSQFGLV